MKEAEKPWIEIGYRSFAYDGPQSIKIERLSRELNKNKSSFYHLFAETEIFINRLLAYHMTQAKIIASKEADISTEKELIDILIEHKIDLLFNRQLRIHRENPEFQKCFNEINQFTFPALMPVWKKLIGFTENTSLAQMVLALSLENFYLQITDETLNEKWLQNYFNEIRIMVSRFKQTGNKASVDGTV